MNTLHKIVFFIFVISVKRFCAESTESDETPTTIFEESIPATTPYSTLVVSNETRPHEIPTLYIVGGRDAYPGEFPHMARIGFGDPSLKYLECSGTLINKNWILTAAHCDGFEDEDPEYVILGAWNQDPDLDEHKKEYRIIEKHFHPEYNANTQEGDIALFKLEKDVEFDEYIQPISLNTDPEFHLNQTKVYVAGWGDVVYSNGSDDDVKSKFLKVVYVFVQPDDKCFETYRDNEYVKYNDTTMICAGYPPGGEDACQADSGGPLKLIFEDTETKTKSFVQVGIVSFGDGCAKKDTPSGYTDISYYIPWIEEKTGTKISQ